MKSNKEPWSADSVATLHEYWGNGWSAAAIAGIIGGVSKAAVIGKAFRLGLSDKQGHGGNRKKQPKRIKQTAPLDLNFGAMPRLEPLPVRDVAPFAGHVGLTLMELGDHQCHWPEGDPLDPGFSFCGAPVHMVGEARKPYCLFHYRRAHHQPEVTK